MSTGTIVVLSALDPSSWDRPYGVGCSIGNRGVRILVGWPCLNQL